MEHHSPYETARRLETELKAAVVTADQDALGAEGRKLVASLRAEALDARLDVRDYELAQTRSERDRHGKAARRRLEHVRHMVVAASDYQLFSGAAVARLSAQIDRLADQLV